MSDRLQCIDSLRQRRRRGLDNDFQKKLSARIVGQPAAVDAVVPFVQMHQAGLSPEGRPLGVFLLLGPTGTGKTRTVEALAEVLHGSPRNLIRVDCGEYQMEHEVAKLIGAPPGYLGHRETQPVLTQGRLAASTTENCNISVVLFDEIEKAAPSLNRLLLGVLDKATLRLGDNNVVNFERSLIFLTSNLGARGIAKELSQGFGFSASRAETAPQLVSKRLARIAENAARRRFSPEFMNRVDAVVTYEPLKSDSLRQILDQQIKTLQEHIMLRLGGQAFNLSISDASRQLLLERGTSPEYGAREIRRTLHRLVTQPIAALVASGKIPAGSTVSVYPKGDTLQVRISQAAA